MSILDKVRNRIRRVRGHLTDYPLIDTGPPPQAREIFAKAYDTYQWGSQESRSGQGSELAATENLRAYLPELFERLNVRTFLDAPCGDWNWMREVDLRRRLYRRRRGAARRRGEHRQLRPARRALHGR